MSMTPTTTGEPCEGTRFAKVSGKETIQVCTLTHGHRGKHVFAR